MELEEGVWYLVLALAVLAIVSIVIYVAPAVFQLGRDDGALVDGEGRRYKLVPAPADGNCGFHALAEGVNVMKRVNDRSYLNLRDTDVRKLLTKEAESEWDYYKEKMLECGYEPGDLASFAEAVAEGGMDGHWLGSKFGELEVMMLAKAIGLRIDLYTNEDSELRCYQTHNFGEKTVGLLFSGEAENGHFDLLVELG